MSRSWLSLEWAMSRPKPGQFTMQVDRLKILIFLTIYSNWFWNPKSSTQREDLLFTSGLKESERKVEHRLPPSLHLQTIRCHFPGWTIFIVAKVRMSHLLPLEATASRISPALSFFTKISVRLICYCHSHLYEFYLVCEGYANNYVYIVIHIRTVFIASRVNKLSSDLISVSRSTMHQVWRSGPAVRWSFKVKQRTNL